MKKRIIPLAVIAAILAVFIGLTRLLSGNNAVNYGLNDGTIDFSDADLDITDRITEGTDSNVAENERFLMSLSTAGNLLITDKASGKIWKAVPDENAANSKYSSSLSLDYFSNNASKATLYSSADSADKKQMKIFALDGGVRVEYVFGEMTSKYIYPEQISEDRMNFLLKKMSETDSEYILRRYTFYDIKSYSGADRDYLLSEYPRLEKENIYVLTDAKANVLKKRTNEIFKSIGYTVKDQQKDNAGSSFETVNPKTFRIAVEYLLTDSGFTVSFDTKDFLYYKDYPITSLNVLPYFDCFSSGDNGYLFVPSGSGALINVEDGKVYSDEEYSLSVYGDNLSLTKELPQNNDTCIFPVFGQYKNGNAFFCIAETNEQDITVNAERAKEHSAISSNFTVLDNCSYKMGAQNPIQLFSPNDNGGKHILKYILLSDQKAETAYSNMANIYREYLFENKKLFKNCNNADTPFLAQIVNTVKYDTLSFGFIPSNKEFALTSFEKTSEIAKEISGYTDKENLNILLNSWNKKGLNSQRISGVKFSGAAGGKSGYKKMVNSLKGFNIFSGVDLTIINPFPFDGYNPGDDGVHSLNNNIVKLSIKDPLMNSFADSKYQLISPDNYNSIIDKYLKNELLSENGFGVSQLTRNLYADYSNKKFNSRSDAVNKVKNSLKKLSSCGKSIIGDAGNAYSLPYLSLINNLPSTSSENRIFDIDVPFAQMVLHGAVPYVSETINGISDENSYALHLIETGSGVNAVITASECEFLFDTDFGYLYNTNYSYIKNSIKKCYETVSNALDGLGDKAIISHCRISNDIVKTEYENGTVIYINYGTNIFKNGSVSVEPQSYVRING